MPAFCVCKLLVALHYNDQELFLDESVISESVEIDQCLPEGNI